MIKTSKRVEENIIDIQKLLNFKNSPKWEILRFLLNISLSKTTKLNCDCHVQNGKEYRLEQITGLGKEEDRTNLYKEMLKIYHNEKYIDNKTFEQYISEHIENGFLIIKTAVENKFNLFDLVQKELLKK